MGNPYLEGAHRLTGINSEERRAICAACGPVAIKRRGSGRWRCASSDKKYKAATARRKKEARHVESRLTIRTACCEAERVLPSIGPRPPLSLAHPSAYRLWEGAVRCPCGTTWRIERTRTWDYGTQPVRTVNVTDDVKYITLMQRYDAGQLTETEHAETFAQACDEDGTYLPDTYDSDAYPDQPA